MSSNTLVSALVKYELIRINAKTAFLSTKDWRIKNNWMLIATAWSEYWIWLTPKQQHNSAIPVLMRLIFAVYHQPRPYTNLPALWRPLFGTEHYQQHKPKRIQNKCASVVSGAVPTEPSYTMGFDPSKSFFLVRPVEGKPCPGVMRSFTRQPRDQGKRCSNGTRRYSVWP